MSRPLASALEKLGRSAGMLPSSHFTEKEKQALNSFRQQTGIIEQVREGRGTRYVVKDRDSLMLHLTTWRPHEATDLETELPPRTINIATARDSKRGSHHHETHYLLLKAAGNQVCWAGTEGQSLDLSRQTQQSGAGAIAIHASDAWQTASPLWLVENQAMFDRMDWLPKGTEASVCLYQGQLHGLLLKWLQTRQRAPEVILFPDYDGVGLLNYARLLEHCQSPCQFWLMSDWESLLTTYGNPDIWNRPKNLEDFHNAKRRLASQPAANTLLPLMNTMQTKGLALEQEVLWLQPLCP